MTDDLFSDLTEPQTQAVLHKDGPLLVLAGPGSGKTRVITRRVAHLVLHEGVAPWNVLAITFTNKASGEMQQRISQYFSPRQAQAVTVATFHALSARLLRQHGAQLGLPPGYSIYDTGDQKAAIKTAMQELEINPKNFPPPAMLSAISNAKNELVDAQQFAANASDFYAKVVAKVYKKYSQILHRHHAVDFDDLLLKTVTLFDEHPDVLAQLQEQYRYLLIDEYQDTNQAQFRIASALAGKHQNLMATGDPDQSIYGWRGANIRNILEFESHFPNPTVIRLEQNYRSTRTILAAADGLIQNNRARHHKALWTDNAPGDPVQIVTCRDEHDEADQVVRRFEQLRDEHQLAWGQMAVFYRMNSLSRVVEEALRNQGIPYQIARGTAFYDRKEIKDAIAYLRALANPADAINLFRIINTPTRGISDKTVKAMQAYGLNHQLSVDQVLAEPTHITSINSRAQSALAQFHQHLTAWRVVCGLSDEGTPPLTDVSLPALVERILRESGLEDYHRNDKSDPDREHLANLGELVNSAQQFEAEYLAQATLDADDPTPPTLTEKLLAFLERISLVADVDAVDDAQGSVTLMTLHAAKGLEYDAVAIVGMEDGLLPHERSQNDEAQLEEERRLCFVGITRAMHHLTLTCARYRTLFGRTTPTIASRFLGELPEDAVEKVDVVDEVAFDRQDDLTQGRGEKEASAYPPGTLVRHAQFGLGRVREIQPMGAHTRAKVDFQTAGPKVLILQYAKLERVEL